MADFLPRVSSLSMHSYRVLLLVNLFLRLINNPYSDSHPITSLAGQREHNNAPTFASAEGPEEGAVLADEALVDVAQELGGLLGAPGLGGRPGRARRPLLGLGLELGLGDGGRGPEAGAARAGRQPDDGGLLRQGVDPALRAAPGLAGGRARELDAAAHPDATCISQSRGGQAAAAAAGYPFPFTGRAAA